MTTPKKAKNATQDKPDVAFTLDQLEAQAAEESVPPLRMGIGGTVVDVPSPMDLPMSSLDILANADADPLAAVQLIQELIGDDVYAKLVERGTTIKVLMRMVSKVQDYYAGAMQDAFGDPKDSPSS